MKRILTITFFTFLFFVFSSTVLAQNAGYIPLAPLPGMNANAPVELSTYVMTTVQIIIGIAGVLAVIMIMIGGVQYMSTDAISGKEEGKSKITQAIFGLVLAIASYLILNTISPNILNVNLTIKQADPIRSGNKSFAGDFSTKEECEKAAPAIIANFEKNNNAKVGSFLCEMGSNSLWTLWLFWTKPSYPIEITEIGPRHSSKVQCEQNIAQEVSAFTSKTGCLVVKSQCQLFVGAGQGSWGTLISYEKTPSCKYP